MKARTSSLPLLLTNYKRKTSSLSLKKNLSSAALKKLSYLKPDKAKSGPEPNDIDDTSDNEPIDEIGGPKYLPTVEIISKKIHHNIIVPTFLPLLNDSGDPIESSFMHRFQFCAEICDFSDPDGDIPAKKAKTNILKELLFYFKTKENIMKLSQECINSLFTDVFEKNIFRSLPPVPEKFLIYGDEPMYTEVSWPHLQHVYNLLFQYQNFFPNDERFNRKFEKDMLKMCHSSDMSERVMIYQFLMKYSEANPKRIPSITRTFCRYCNLYYNKCAYPFVLTPALNYFLFALKSTPTLSRTYLNFFTQFILPLIQCNHFITLHPLIVPIIEFILQRKIDYSEFLLKYIIQHFPLSLPSKQVFYVQLVLIVLQTMPLKEFSKICPIAFKFFAQCYLSNNHKLAEFSYRIWSNVKIITLSIDNTRLIYPFLIEPLTTATKMHWSSTTRTAAYQAYKQMHDLDPFVFEDIAKRLTIKVKNQEASQENFQLKNWLLIARTAAYHTKYSFDLAATLNNIQKEFTPKKIV